MGLLQDNKSRRKISNDPNNTKWTRDTTTFGQKILRSQGWQPGQFLGAQDAPHAALHSAASASYIRVVLKDDMKGLGFNKAREDEVTGLDVFSDLLSRLNGKSEAAVREDQDARLAVKTHRYVEMRWGPMRFVRGGLLVGDTLEEDGGAESEVGEDEESKQTEEQKGKKQKKSKKRKVEEADEEGEEEVDSDAARKKDKKRRRKEGDEDDAAEKKKRKKEKKETKKTKNMAKSRNESDDSDDNELSERAAKKKAKQEKKEKKKEKREKKEEKRRRKAAKTAAATADTPNSSSSSDDDDKDDTDAGTSATPATAGSSSGTATPLGHRTFVRSRYIAQKRQAVMDAKALAQIFMIKA